MTGRNIGNVRVTGLMINLHVIGRAHHIPVIVFFQTVAEVWKGHYQSTPGHCRSLRFVLPLCATSIYLPK